MAGRMLRVCLPRNERLLQSFRESVPWRARWWLPREHCWQLRPKYERTIRDLAADYSVTLDIVEEMPCAPNNPTT